MIRKTHCCYSSGKKPLDFLPSAPEESWYSGNVLSQRLFEYLCERNCAGTRRLDMRGRILDRAIRRRLQDADVPALMIFLKKNQDVLDVDLGYNNISDAGFKNLIDHCTRYANLHELNVRNNNVTKAGLSYLLEVAEGLRIRSLLLSGNKFGVEGSKSLALFLLKNSFVSRLDLADVDQTASSLIYFLKILTADQNSLITLDVSRPNPGCMHFLDSRHLSGVIGRMLKVISRIFVRRSYSYGAHLPLSGLATLLQHNRSLEELHLQKYRFDCHDVESMMSLARCNVTLRWLDLGCNNIGDHGVDQLASWLRMRPALRALTLHRNNVTDHGARALGFGVPYSRLTSLDISHNKVTDDGLIDLLNSLKKSPMLRHLKIFGNRIGHRSAQIVRRMLVSKVLTQEHLDAKPYRVDRQWHFAEYPANRSERICRCLTHPRTTSPVTVLSKYKYLKYVYSRIEVKSLQLHHAKASSRSKDCKCCYCYQCEGDNREELCRESSHGGKCTCCKCRAVETDDGSSLELTAVDKSGADLSENMQRILGRVESVTRRKISRWINMDESTLEEDLRAIALGGVAICCAYS